MVVSKLNNRGIWTLSTILTIILNIFIINFTTDVILILLVTPFNLGISLIISSNVVIIEKKKSAPQVQKVANFNTCNKEKIKQ